MFGNRSAIVPPLLVFFTNNPPVGQNIRKSFRRSTVKYIHNNPVRAGIRVNPADYKYSSASFYNTGKSIVDFLSHYAY